MLDCRVNVPRVCQREMGHQVVTGRAEGTDSTIEIIRSVPTGPLDYRSKSMRPNLYVLILGRTKKNIFFVKLLFYLRFICIFCFCQKTFVIFYQRFPQK
jgi:hypothetical protein